MPAARIFPYVPPELVGKWVAWTADHARIIASADSPDDARTAAQRAGERDPILLWVPPADERFVGGGA